MPLPFIIPLLGVLGGAAASIVGAVKGKTPVPAIATVEPSFSQQQATLEVQQANFLKSKEARANENFMSMVRKYAIWVIGGLVVAFLFFKKKR